MFRLNDDAPPPVAPGTPVALPLVLPRGRQQVWIGIGGVAADAVQRLQLRIGARLVLDLDSAAQPGRRPVPAGRMVEAIARYSGRRGLQLEVDLRDGEAGCAAMLLLWLAPQAAPGPLRAAVLPD